MANPNKPRSHKKTQAPLILRSLRSLVVFCCFFLRRDVALWANLLPDHHYCWNNPGFRCTASYFSDTILNGLSQQCENKIFFFCTSLTHPYCKLDLIQTPTVPPPPPGGVVSPRDAYAGSLLPLQNPGWGESISPQRRSPPCPGQDTQVSLGSPIGVRRETCERREKVVLVMLQDGQPVRITLLSLATYLYMVLSTRDGPSLQLVLSFILTFFFFSFWHSSSLSFPFC